ncbi:hypothetical protein GGI07_003885 [Coemansia sp. Benny D115]|nr:hypothetical protein GGI07_003885 [Coemansia sp. Benny D115]
MAPASSEKFNRRLKDAFSRYRHSASMRFLSIHRRPHHATAATATVSPLDPRIPALYGCHAAAHLAGMGKSGYLMVWDRGQGSPGWVLEFCTITAAGEFVCLSKETSQPLLVIDLRTTACQMASSGAWGRPAIEVCDAASSKLLVCLRADSRAETGAWFLELQCWAAAGPALLDSEHQRRHRHRQARAANVPAAGKNTITPWEDEDPDAAQEAGSCAVNHSHSQRAEPVCAQHNATLLLPTQSRKPPQLVQALIHTMAPAAHKFCALVTAYSHSLQAEEDEDHQDVFSFFSYPRSTFFTDIMQPCLPANSDVRILLAGLLYLRTRCSGDLFNPISHVLARNNSEWHPYIGVLAQCEDCVSLLLYEVGDDVVFEVADIDVRMLTAHEIQAEDDSLFDGGSFGFHITLSSDGPEPMPSGHSLAETPSTSNPGTPCNCNEHTTTTAAASTQSTPNPDTCRPHHGCNHERHKTNFADDTTDSCAKPDDCSEDDRARRRRSKSLGYLMGFDSLSLGGSSSSNNNNNNNSNDSSSGKRTKHGLFGKSHSKEPKEPKQGKGSSSIGNGSGNGSSHTSLATATTGHPSMPSVLYLAAMRASERNSWIAQLRRYAQTQYSGAIPRPPSSPVSAPLVFRMERCLWIKVQEVQGLPRGNSTAVALVVIDGHVVAQSEVASSSSKPHIEATSHFFGSLPPIQRGVHVLVRHKDKHAPSGAVNSGSASGTNSGGGLLGYCQIPIPTLQRGCTYDGWYPLSHGNVSAIDQQIGSYLPLAPNVKPSWRRWTSKAHSHQDSHTPSTTRPSTPFRSGDVHVKIRYDELVVLTSPYYTDTITMLLDTRPTLIFDLVAVLPRSADWLIETTAKIAICSNRVVPWVEAIVRHELGSQASPDPALIFRGTSVATRAMDTLMKVVGLTFLDQMIGNVVRDVAAGSYHCEVDPSRLRRSTKIDVQWRILLHLSRAVWLGIEESMFTCPPTMRRVFAGIREAIEHYYSDCGTEPGHANANANGGNACDQVRYSCISGFLFLRLVCPAMLSPKTFGLVGTHPNASALRTLTLLAKGIQCTANLTDFALKEPYMQPMNAFVQQSVPMLKHFIDCISEDCIELDPLATEDMDVDADMESGNEDRDENVAGDGSCGQNQQQQQQQQQAKKEGRQVAQDEEAMAIMAIDRERELAALCNFIYSSRKDIRQALANGKLACGGPLSSKAPMTISAAAAAAAMDLSGSTPVSPARSQFTTNDSSLMQKTDEACEAREPPTSASIKDMDTQSTRSQNSGHTTVSTTLSDTYRLIEGLVQACEVVQECVEACLKSPFASAIQSPEDYCKDSTAF